ncbi:MAG: hypothetical protein WAW73_18030 [Rhodoferax sp.]
MAVLQDDGRIALAVAVASQPIHLAWGRGDPAWDITPEPEPTNATTLVDEVGRRLVTFVGYAEPNNAGEIELPSGDRYTVVAGPTQWVYIRTVFNFEDAVGETLRELGVFIGSQPVAGLPAGQRYFTPAEIASPGRFYTMDRIPHFTRNGAVRQTFEYVLPF